MLLWGGSLLWGVCSGEANITLGRLMLLWGVCSGEFALGRLILLWGG
ncbi:MAG TPA: hypothetical protein P5543_06035 [Planctomycetota bacterium]|nr:hypothetical protein [Planctomycetota bacterium]